MTFEQHDQRRFAELSGDFNPIHLDAVVARRVSAGEPIVHGMHLLLRTLDGQLRRRPLRPIGVSATFLHPIIAGESLRLARADGALAVTDQQGETVAIVHLDASVTAPTASMPRTGLRRRLTRPAVRGLDGLESAAGVWPVRPYHSTAARLFPHAVRALGASTVAAIAAISGIVGMECPGRDSLLASASVQVVPKSRPGELTWRVTRVDRRFGFVRLAVAGTGIAAEVTAFLRRAPAPPPTVDAAARHVTQSEFEGQRALIVGGSRGLGAATAVIVAAGGGLPIVTYAAGRAEAAALRRMAAAAGRAIEAIHFDVVSGDVSALAMLAEKRGVTHLYYFATPRIFGRRHDPFDTTAFERFADFYVSRFAAVCAAIRARVEALTVFYPSSTAIDERQAELTEYAAAKAAGESVCRVLEARDSGLRIVVNRLPRVDTDQTVSTLNARAIDPLDAMLPIVRQMQQR